LVEAEQVEGEEHCEEGGLGAEELTHAKAPGRQIVFEFLDALFDTGPPVVIAPDDLGRLAANRASAKTATSGWWLRRPLRFGL
jgi:hypothetical protein